MKYLLIVDLLVILICFLIPKLGEIYIFYSSWKTKGREIKWFQSAKTKYDNPQTRPEAYFMFQLKFNNTDLGSFHKFFTGKKSSQNVDKEK